MNENSLDVMKEVMLGVDVPENVLRESFDTFNESRKNNIESYFANNPIEMSFEGKKVKIKEDFFRFPVLLMAEIMKRNSIPIGQCFYALTMHCPVIRVFFLSQDISFIEHDTPFHPRCTLIYRRLHLASFL